MVSLGVEGCSWRCRMVRCRSGWVGLGVGLGVVTMVVMVVRWLAVVTMVVMVVRWLAVCVLRGCCSVGVLVASWLGPMLVRRVGV